MSGRRVTEPLPGYQHPSREAWLKGCRCHPCWRSRQHEYNRRSRCHEVALTDAAAARAHLRALVDAGFRITLLATVSGADKRHLRRLLDGKFRRVGLGIEAMILDLDIESLMLKAPGAAFVPAVGTVRRLQALAFMGWDPFEFCDTPTERSVMQRYLDGASRRVFEADNSGHVEIAWHGTERRVTARSHRWVKGLYEKYSMREGNNAETRERARRNGYASPLAWDTSTIDDPAAWPNHGTEAGTPAEAFVENVRWYLDWGDNPMQVCQWLGVSLEAMLRRLRRHGHHDLADRFVAPMVGF